MGDHSATTAAKRAMEMSANTPVLRIITNRVTYWEFISSGPSPKLESFLMRSSSSVCCCIWISSDVRCIVRITHKGIPPVYEIART